MITEERIVKVLKNGCPKCKSFNLAVDSTERVRRLVSIHSSTPGSIVWDKAEYIDTVSEDYIICGDCGWQEPEK